MEPLRLSGFHKRKRQNWSRDALQGQDRNVTIDFKIHHNFAIEYRFRGFS